MKLIRSDLAVEIFEDLTTHHSPTDGIECTTSQSRSVELEKVRVLNEEGEKTSGKPVGTYVTLNVGKLWLDDPDSFRQKVFVLRDELVPFVKAKRGKGAVLVAGLGNRGIQSDAIGPVTVQNLIVTRHLRTEAPDLFKQLSLGEVAAITPGVLGQTGIESAGIVRAVTREITPAMIVVVDALAARNLSRLATTIQLCDTGISPGSGIGNGRPALIPEEMGIPVVSIGVPTVVDAATLAADAGKLFGEKAADEDEIRAKWSQNGLNFFVSPKESDQVTRVMGTLIAYALNLVLHDGLGYEEMLSWIG